MNPLANPLLGIIPVPRPAFPDRRETDWRETVA